MITQPRGAATSTIVSSNTIHPQFYVPIPQRLVTLLYDTPLAIGIYTLIARLYQIAKAPVPLSAPDLLRYDPSISRGAALRALDRLISSGYLIAQGTDRQKRSYTPAWGCVRGAPLAWDLAAPCLGRPRHIETLRLDQRLLDTCMGRLVPHPTRAATITRYLTMPLLGIADLGAYALTLLGLPRPTAALERLGLISAGVPQPLMSDTRLLALASQQTLGGEPGATLTASGARKLGIAPILPPNIDTAQPLFFVPPALIGGLIDPLIDPLIGQSTLADQAPSPLQREKIATTPANEGITWINMNPMESRNPPPTPPSTSSGGGGQQRSFAKLNNESTHQLERHQVNQRLPVVIPQTESAQLLRTVNIRPEIIAELASLPLSAIQQAIADAQARPYVRDIAAWVVSLLRAHRDHAFTITPPAPPANSPESLGRYFAEQAARQEAERVASEPQNHGTAGLLDTQVEVRAEEEREGAIGSSGDLATLIQRELRWRLERTQRPLASQFQIRFGDDGTAQLICRRSADMLAIQTHIVPVVRRILSEQEDIPIKQIIVTTAAPLPAAPPSDSAPPSWIPPARWATLPPMLRTLLLGSTIVDGQIHAASPALTALLHNRYQAELAALKENTDEQKREVGSARQPLLYGPA